LAVTGPLAQLDKNPKVCHPSKGLQEAWPSPGFAVLKHGQWAKSTLQSFYDAKNQSKSRRNLNVKVFK
jgi:hypothetical protein